MKIEDIYEIISGKLMELLENQPNEVTSCQNKLDDMKEIYHKWQRLTPIQRNAVKVHIDSYIKGKGC